MTIRYVQTNDNKYVQYRLMSDTFNTTVANWQGVDDEPTAGSENLVKSGGVVKHLADNLGNMAEPENWTLVGNCSISAEGRWSVGDTLESKSFDVTKLRGSKLVVAANNIGVAIISFVKRINYPTPPIFATGETGRHIIPVSTSDEFIVPVDANYAVVNTKNDNQDNTPLILEEFSRFNAIEHIVNNPDSEPIEKSKNFVTSDGIHKALQMNYSDFCSIGNGGVIQYKENELVSCITAFDRTKKLVLYTGNVEGYVAFYDSNQEFYDIYSLSGTQKTFNANSIPASCAYLRCSFSKTDMSAIKIVNNNIIIWKPESTLVTAKETKAQFDLYRGIDPCYFNITNHTASATYATCLPISLPKGTKVDLSVPSGFLFGCKFSKNADGTETVYETHSRVQNVSITLSDDINYFDIVIQNTTGTFEAPFDAFRYLYININDKETFNNLFNRINEQLAHKELLHDIVNSKIFKTLNLAWTDKNNNYESWPNGGVMADGNEIVIIYNSSSAHVATDLVSDIIMRKKYTFGDFGEKSIILEHTANEGYGNPSCCILPNGDYLVTCSILTASTVSQQIMAIKMIKSTDKGETWTDMGNVQVNGVDVVDECMQGIFCTSSGKLISFVGGNNNCKFIASDDLGVTWRYVGESPSTNTLEACFYERTNGEILSILRKNNSTPALIKLNASLTSYEILYEFGTFAFPAYYNPSSIIKMLDGKLYMLAGSRRKEDDNKYLLVEAIATEDELLANTFNSRVILKAKATNLMDWGYAQAVIAQDGVIYGYYYDAEVTGRPSIYEMMGC